MSRLIGTFLACLLLAACGGDPKTVEPTTETAHEEGDHHGETEHGGKGEQSQTRIPAEIARQSGIETAVAGPARIRETVALHGTIVPDPRRVFRIRARYPGIVKVIRKEIGDRVKAGEVIAVIESDESLQPYSIVAPSDGVVVTRDANVGVSTGDEPLLTVVDLSNVWVELASFQHDMARIRPRQQVLIRDVDGHANAEGHVENVAVVGSAASQSMTVRVVLPNPTGEWRPGLFVTGDVVVDESEVPLAVSAAAIQTHDGTDVVFELNGDTYEARRVVLGRRDAEMAEVREGIEPGTVYVTTNSYLIKADIEKSGTAHDH